MRNPFKKDNHILPIASINSLYVDDILASDLFRPTILVEEIIKYKDLFGIQNTSDFTQVLLRFNEVLNDDLDSIKEKAMEIARNFGNRLAKVLITLKKPSLKSISNRKNWNQTHWDYWKKITKIYLVGGLTSPILIKIFYDEINQALHKENITDLQVIFIEGSQNLGTKGLSTEVMDGRYLLFDFGQTMIKRAFHVKENNMTVLDTVLPPVSSKYLFYKEKSTDEINDIALKLHKYILKVIKATVKEVHFDGHNILISIANYVQDGAIYSSRGGYGKLASLSPHYQSFLENELSLKLNRTMFIKLYHDTSAMSLLFKGEKHSAVISLGTAFGVAFPD